MATNSNDILKFHNQKALDKFSDRTLSAGIWCKANDITIEDEFTLNGVGDIITCIRTGSDFFILSHDLKYFGKQV